MSRAATTAGCWVVSDAQQAVNVVAAVMVGQPRRDVAAELDDWLGRRGAVLPEPQYRWTVDAIAGGSAVVLLRPAARGGAAGSGP
jgi:hypothetical protein